MNEPIITVIIPTRDRCDVLRSALKTVTSQDYERLRIIISDNCSVDATRDIVAENRDPRIQYINPGKRVSMSNNWEFALTHVAAGWITIMGDDDGLLPGALRRVAEIVQEVTTTAIRSDVCAYTWPSATLSGFGRLSVPLGSGWEIRDAAQWLRRVLNGRAHYRSLPMLYNGGFVHADVVADIRRRMGAFYHSSVPDVYSAVSIASCVKSYVYLREPLAINGASKHSTGTSFFSRRAQGAASPSAKYLSEGNLPFHADLVAGDPGGFPKSLPGIVYESFLQSAPLRSADEASLVTRADQLRLILAAWDGEPEEVAAWGRKFATTHGLDFRESLRGMAAKRMLLRVKAFQERLLNVLNTWGTGSQYLEINDVYEASVIAGKVLASRAGRFKNMHRLIRRGAIALGIGSAGDA